MESDKKSEASTQLVDSVQQRLLTNISSILPLNISLVGELSDLLDISNDSAYRRIRGETDLSINEITILCNHYKISFDSLITTDSNVVSFVYDEYNRSLESFLNYFKGLSTEVEQIRHAAVEEKHLTYLGHSLPILHYFDQPNLGPFKIHYWMNSHMNPDANSDKFFKANLLSEQLSEAGKKITANYTNIPSTEIWTDSSIVGVLEQIRFYWDTGLFETRDEALIISNEVRAMIQKIQKEATIGKKFTENGDEITEGAEFNFYYSEFEFENTCVHVELGSLSAVYLGHLTNRYIKTVNSTYNNIIKSWYESIKNKSNLLSKSSETTRFQFFKRCTIKIDQLEEYINK
jgi:hypothetical protein